MYSNMNMHVVYRLLALLLPIACFDIHVYLQIWHQSVWYVTDHVDITNSWVP